MNSELLSKAYNIRNFENALLDLFPKGLIKGTTHTSLGQETNAVGVISALNKDDIVVSNHRCHGHYLSHTNDYKGLLNEILGKENGVCGGIGGSQHLCFENVFYSNGILGGNSPMAAGISYALKFKKLTNIVCLFVGDGTLGQGVFYETLNLISKNKLPILIIIEDNEISQSTETKKVLAGKISNKIKSFDIEVMSLEYPDLFELNTISKKIIKDVRSKTKPFCLIIKSNRMGPHSKGDDTRTKKELEIINKNDTLEKTSLKFNNDLQINLIKKKSEEFIRNLYFECLNEKITKNNSKIKNSQITNKANINSAEILSKIKNKRFSEIINNTLHNLFEENNKILLIGEDINDPYGGAFKISKGLSSKFPKRVYSSPISEAGIIGLATGIAIQGLNPIVEIMFGDFLGIGFDQILNNASKFRKMYNNKVSVPLIIRTPMGGRRGYGPTHSQSIEKHFFGIENLNIYALNPFQDLHKIYRSSINSKEPSLIIENKIDYAFVPKKIEKDFYDDFKVKHYDEENNFNISFSLTNFKEDDGAIICYGGILNQCLNAAKKFFIEEEISFRIVCLGKLHPFNINKIKDCLPEKGKVISVEESTADFSLSSEICLELLKLNKFEFVDRIGAKSSLIPSSYDKEKLIFLDDENLFDYLKKIH